MLCTPPRPELLGCGRATTTTRVKCPGSLVSAQGWVTSSAEFQQQWDPTDGGPATLHHVLGPRLFYLQVPEFASTDS